MAVLLKPSKLAYFFVGDAVISGKLFNITDAFVDIVSGTELKLVADTNYSLESVTRSFHEKKSKNCHGGRRNLKKRQHILVFEKINRTKSNFVSTRTKAVPISQAKLVSLSTDFIVPGQLVSLQAKGGSRHIHSLGRYPSKFIPDIPRWAIKKYSVPNDTVLDPFSGSGTTAVEALVHGRRAISSDISPYSCLLTESKTSYVDESKLQQVASNFVQEIGKGLHRFSTSPLSFPLSDFWFQQSNLDEIARCRRYIELVVPPDLQPFMLAILSTIIRPCSYQDEGQIKVKRDPKKVLNGTPSPFDLLPQIIHKAIKRKIEYLSLVSPLISSTIFHSSADKLLATELVTPESVDLIVTSPPYINAMNYPMTHRYENILLGLLNHAEKHKHESEYFGSERVYARDYNKIHALPNEFEMATKINQALIEIFKGEPKRSYIAYRFFSFMRKSIHDFSQILRNEGVLVLVVGRNKIKGVPVDTFGILTSMLEASGMKLETSFEYEIIKNAFKLTRHSTADIIKTDGVAVFKKVAQ